MSSAAAPAPARRARRHVVIWVIAIASVTVVLVLNDRSTMVAQLVGNIGLLGAVIVSSVFAFRASRWRTSLRGAWVATGIAMGLSALGQASYVSAAISGSQSPPSATVDAVVFVSYSVPLLVALFLFPRRSDALISRFRQVLDVLVITTGVVLVSMSTVLGSVGEVIDLSTLAGLVRFAYPIADITLCSATLCLGMRQLPGDRLVWLCFGGGLIALAVTDSIYVRLLSEGQDLLTATPLIAGWMLAPALLALATVMPRRSDAGRAGDAALFVQLVPYVPVLGAIIVVVIGRPLDDPFILATGLALLIAVTVRQVMIVYENVLLTRDLESRVAARTAELTTLGSIVTSSSQAVVGISLQGVVTAWNPAAELLYGRRAADVLDRPLTFLSAEAREGVRALLADAVAGNPLSTFELEWRRPDGVTVPVALTVSPVADETGVQGISVTGQDITERRRAAEVLEQAREEALESSRLKSEFLATMSHEIRTPMNGVLGLTTLLLSTELDARQRQYAEGVQGAGEALMSVINDILDFSKLEAGKVVLDPVDFDPRHLMDEVGALLAPAASSKGLELITYCLPDVPDALYGDHGRIRQILLNLAANAVKFTSDGEVSVRGRSFPTEDGDVLFRIDVTDTGIGIADKDQRQLFQSFSQADASTTRRFGGTGLGLAICRRLVEVMGGDIGLESKPGVGSRFWFEVPLRLGAAAGRTPVAQLRHDLLDGLRVLVVDDNATNRTVLEGQLRSWGMDPELAESGAVALQRLRERAVAGRPFNLAALDMLMPEMDGLQLAQYITADPVLQGTPLIMLTSSPPVEPEVFEDAGIGQWLIKPVRSSELYDRLVRLMAPLGTEQVRRPSPAGPAAVPAGSPGVVLVVEDNELNQLVAEGVLRRLGFKVQCVGDGAQAVEALQSGTYGAVLMDCHMPTMDGFAATREIRRREHGRGRGRIPIIAMTAGAQPEDRAQCLAAGMDAYVTKPIDLDALAGVLADLAQSPFAPLDASLDHASDGPPPPSGEPPAGNGAASSGEPPAGDGAAPVPPIDEARVDALRELTSPEGSSLLRAFVSSFVARSADRVVAVRLAAGQPETAELVAAAHELRGAAGTIGAVRVAQMCEELEMLARAGATASPALVDDLATAVDHANEALLSLSDHRPRP